MLAAILSVQALLVGVGLMMLGNGLQGTLLGVRASQEGFDTLAIGLVMTCYFAGFLAGSVVTTRVVRRVGHIRVFAALTALASAAVLLHALLVTPWFWGPVRCVTGFCFAGLYVIAESWLNDRADNRTRGTLLSAYMVVSLGAMTLGQLLLNVGDPLGTELFILTSVLVSLAVVPIALSASRAPGFAATTAVSIALLYRSSPLGVVGMAGQGVANAALMSLSAVYAQSVGMSLAATAWFASAPLIGGLLAQWPVGRLSDRFDRRKVFTVTAVVGAAVGLASAAVPATTAPLWQALAAGLLGAATLPQYALSIAHTNDHLQPAQMVAASGTLVLVGGAGMVFGPTLAALLMHALDPGGWFLAIGVVQALVAVFALHRMRMRAPVPLAEQGPFVSLSARSSPVAAQAASQLLQDDQGS